MGPHPITTTEKWGKRTAAVWGYLFSVVGTSRCDVRAACSGATSPNASVARMFVAPAATRAGTAQRAIPTIALNTYSPLGRGRPFTRFVVKGRAAFAGHALDQFEILAGFSLSPRERARVRGNAVFDPFAALIHL